MKLSLSVNQYENDTLQYIGLLIQVVFLLHGVGMDSPVDLHNISTTIRH